MKLPIADRAADRTDTHFTADAVATLHAALVAGGGRMAQFAHPEFGGAGQWMHPDLLMLPMDTSRELRERVGRLCETLAADIVADGADSVDRDLPPSTGFQSQSQGSGAGSGLDVARSRWWPSTLGTPETSGSQDGRRYAWFAGARRLLVDDDGRVTAYDTGPHRLSGVAQQQGVRGTLAFSGDQGPIDLARLPVVDAALAGAVSAAGREAPPHAATAAVADPFVALEKLAGLHARGIVSDDEFAAKKGELLRRI